MRNLGAVAQAVLEISSMMRKTKFGVSTRFRWRRRRPLGILNDSERSPTELRDIHPDFRGLAAVVTAAALGRAVLRRGCARIWLKMPCLRLKFVRRLVGRGKS